MHYSNFWAPWGSALACLISYGYITMLGSKGLTDSTKMAILNANYIKERLDGYYPTLYTGEKGRAAHEMIIDCRDLKTTELKWLISPNAYRLWISCSNRFFPVAGTMMIEPTESENIQNGPFL